MKKVLFLFGFLLFGLVWAVNQTAYAADQVRDEWIIYLKNDSSYQDFSKRYESRIIDSQKQIVKGQFTKDEIEKIKLNRSVFMVEPNYPKDAAQAIMYNDSLLKDQWSLEKVDASSVLNKYKEKTKNIAQGKQISYLEKSQIYNG